MNINRVSKSLLFAFVFMMLTGLNAVLAQEGVTIPPENEPLDNTPGTAIPISCGNTISAAIDTNSDVDFYKFTVNAGDSMVAYIEANELGSAVDPVITLYQPNGTHIIKENDDYDWRDSRLHYTFDAAGTYYLKVTSYQNNSAGFYNLSLDTPYYVSVSANGSVDGINYATADVLAYYACSDRWAMFLDMSDVGVTANTNGFAMMPGQAQFLMTLGAANLPGVGKVTAQDVVYFNADDLGTDTQGVFTLFFDGSDVGLSTTGEAIDAIAIGDTAPLGSGQFLLSIKENGNVPGVSSVVDEDLLRFIPTSWGANTSGTWELRFDGSDEGLAATDVWGLWQNQFSDDLYFSFEKPVTIEGTAVNNGDIASCRPGTLGANTNCTNWLLPFDASAVGLGSKKVDAVDRGDMVYPENYGSLAAEIATPTLK